MKMADLRIRELLLLGVAFTLLKVAGGEGGDFPRGWHKLCRKDVDYVTQYTEISLNWTQPVIQISCIVSSADHVLYFVDFRRWSGSQNNSIALKVSCEHIDVGSFHLPWPMKAQNLVFLQIRGCFIKDYYSEHFSSDILNISDSIRILDIRDSSISFSVWDLSTLVKNYSRMSPDVRCGPLTMEAFVFSNATYDLDMGTDWNITEAMNMLDPMDFGSELFMNAEEITFKCRFEYLRLLDQSYYRNLNTKHFYNLMSNSMYPVLQVYNISNANLVFLPDELKSWRLKFPKMRYLDLSRNNIRSFMFTDVGSLDDGKGIIDLRYNNISQLSWDDIDVLQHMKTATIDLRNNPWSCTCRTNEYLYEYWHQHPNLSAVGLSDYETLIHDLVCATPPSLAGHPLYTLSPDQVYCQQEPNPFIKVAVVVLSLAVVTFGIAILLVPRRAFNPRLYPPQHPPPVW